MARHGHMADGRLKLVLVRRCSPLQYLRFLVCMSRSGCAPGQLPYVTVVDAVAAAVEPLALGNGRGAAGAAAQSCWNLGGCGTG